MESLVRLIQFLMRESGVPLQNVVTHRGVTGNTICPGTRFPLYTLRRALASYADASVLP